jgi:hypothetical protein
VADVATIARTAKVRPVIPRLPILNQIFPIVAFPRIKGCFGYSKITLSERRSAGEFERIRDRELVSGET